MLEPCIISSFLGQVVGHFWRANPGYSSRAPKDHRFSCGPFDEAQAYQAALLAAECMAISTGYASLHCQERKPFAPRLIVSSEVPQNWPCPPGVESGMTQVKVLTVQRIKEIRDRTATGKITRTSLDEEAELCDLALAYLAEHPEVVGDEGQG
jgi:hypothetical protein